MINTATTSYGYNLDILQSYQPTQTGAKSKDSLYFFELPANRIGSPKRISSTDINGKTINQDYQLTAQTYQISSLVRAPKTYTASDILNDLAIYMQSDEFITALSAAGIGIMRITDIRANYFKDDKDQHQNSPSFDFTLTYNRTIIRNENPLTGINFTLERV